MSSNVLPIFKDSHIDFLSQAVDNAIKAKGLIELVDQPVTAISLKIINGVASPKISEDFKTSFHEVLDSVIEKDYKEAGVTLAGFINDAVDIPMIDENTESFIFTGFMTYVVGLLNLD
jgi:hypothetical protein